MLTQIILGPTLYLCCFLVWSCLGKTMSSASKQLNKRKWAKHSRVMINSMNTYESALACNADNPDSVVFSLSIDTKRRCEK